MTTFVSTDPYLDVEDASKGLRAKFEAGTFETDDGDLIDFLKGLPYFGIVVVEDSDVTEAMQAAIDSATKGPVIIPESVTTGAKQRTSTTRRNVTGSKGRVPTGVVTELPPEGEDVSTTPVAVYEGDDPAAAAVPAVSGPDSTPVEAQAAEEDTATAKDAKKKA